MTNAALSVVRIILLFLCILLPAGQVSADSCSPGSREPEAMHADLHDAVTRAERTADTGEYEKAAGSLTRYLEKHPDQAHAYPYYDIGYFLHQGGKSELAVKPLNTAVKLDQCFTEAWQLLAVVYDEIGNTGKAAEVMERAASLSKSDDMTYQTAVFMIRDGKPGKAVVLLNTLLAKNSKNPDWYIALANALQDLNRPADAAQAMEKAAEPEKNPEYRYQAALLWLEAENPRKALPLLKSLSEMPSAKAEWLVALSNALQALEQKVETAQAMEAAAKKSNDPDMAFQAAWLWLEADRPKNALPLLQTICQRKKPKTDWFLALCNTYIILEKPLEAAKAMDRVIAMDDKPEHLYNGGVLWLQVEKPKKALAHLLRLADLPSPKAEWFVAVGYAWIALEDIPKAAEAMEKAAHISGKPEHIYQAGILRLQLEQADAALTLLLPLQEKEKPEAKWLIAVSNAWIMKERFGEAATAMERASDISGDSAHVYRASKLWLQDEKPRRALPLLKRLAATPKPKADWLLTLVNTCLMLEDIPGGAEAMERAASITQKGEHYYRAGSLWRQANNIDKAIDMCRLSIRKKPVKQKWLVDLASLLIETNQEKEAESVMEKTELVKTEVEDGIRYRGAVLWLSLLRPEKALPILERLCRSSDPKYNWLVSLVRTSVELGRFPQAEKALDQLLTEHSDRLSVWDLSVWMALQQSDYVKASAAMEVAARLDAENGDRKKELSRLYHMAGSYEKAVRAYSSALGSKATPSDWDRMVDIFLSGGRYDLALEPAKKAAMMEETADRWENVGDIAYHLHRFEESEEAYGRAVDLSETGRLLMKMGYVYVKFEDYDQAVRYFKRALTISSGDDDIEEKANAYLNYITELRNYMNQETY